MAPSNRAQDNRNAVPAAADVLSPELVLVSPPEAAARARELLWETVPPAAAPKRVAAGAQSGSSELERIDRSFQTDARAEPAHPDNGAASGASRRGAAVFDAICVAGTLGPLLLAVFSR